MDAQPPRRAPQPPSRRRDAQRTQQTLLDAALVEFAEHGLAGARVSAIAARAGVNKQLISYYFDGKEGLYRALVSRWLEQEAEFAPLELPLDERVARYAGDGVEHRAMHRVLLRESLDDREAAEPAAGPSESDLADLRRRQADGELAADLDPAFLLLALQGAASAGVTFPGDVRRLTGLDPDAPEFAERYGEQLRRLVRHLAPQPRARTPARSARRTAGERRDRT